MQLKMSNVPLFTPRMPNATIPVDVPPVTVPGSPPKPPASQDRSLKVCPVLAETLEPLGHVRVSPSSVTLADTVPALVVSENARLLDCCHAKHGLLPEVIEKLR